MSRPGLKELELVGLGGHLLHLLCYNDAMPSQAEWEFLTPEQQLWWAWLAGLIDGEGCIQISPDRRYPNSFRLSLGILMTCQKAVRQAKHIAGGKVYNYPPPRSGRREVFRWQVLGKKAATCLRICLPYFVVKKEEAAIALQFIELQSLYGKGNQYRRVPAAVLERRRALAEALKILHKAP